MKIFIKIMLIQHQFTNIVLIQHQFTNIVLLQLYFTKIVLLRHSKKLYWCSTSSKKFPFSTGRQRSCCCAVAAALVHKQQTAGTLVHKERTAATLVHKGCTAAALMLTFFTSLSSIHISTYALICIPQSYALSTILTW